MCISDQIQNMIHISDWIQDMYIRLDPKSVMAHTSLSSAPSLAPRHQPSWHRPCVMSRRLMQMSKHAVQCDKCHDMSWCHVSRDVFLEGLCCHSSWYLLSLTLVIGFVTVDQLPELRLYILTWSYHSVHHIERWESSYYLIQSPDFVLSVHLLLHSVKIWRSRSVSWNDAYPPPHLYLDLFFLNLERVSWVRNNYMSDNLWTFEQTPCPRSWFIFSVILNDAQNHRQKAPVVKTDLKSGSKIRFKVKWLQSVCFNKIGSKHWNCYLLKKESSYKI